MFYSLKTRRYKIRKLINSLLKGKIKEINENHPIHVYDMLT